MRVSLIIGLLLLFASFAADADERNWDWSADVAVEARLFTEDARWAGQDSATAQPALAATGEWRWRSDGGNQRVSIMPFLRWDQVDDERSRIDLLEAYWAYEGQDWELLVGSNTVFWGVTESVHLVDIINQTDAAGDIDGEEKLGQPMVNLALQRDWGQVSLFVLPYFRERTYPGTDGRLRPPLPVDGDAAHYASSREQSHVDFALRYSHYIGDMDIGLSAFTGTSREARWVPAADGESLEPWYDQIDQIGIDLQYTKDAWLLKLEAIWRDGYSESFAAAVAGFEYTWFQVSNAGADLGVLLEYQYDGRGPLEPVTLNDNDLFAGARLALNDTQDTAVLAGASVDVDTGELFLNLEAERRIGDDWFLELRARAFSGSKPDEISYSVEKDDYVQFVLARYF